MFVVEASFESVVIKDAGWSVGRLCHGRLTAALSNADSSTCGGGPAACGDVMLRLPLAKLLVLAGQMRGSGARFLSSPEARGTALPRLQRTAAAPSPALFLIRSPFDALSRARGRLAPISSANNRLH